MEPRGMHEPLRTVALVARFKGIRALMRGVIRCAALEAAKAAATCHGKCSPAVLGLGACFFRADDGLEMRTEPVPGLEFRVQESTAVNIFQSELLMRNQVE